MVVSPELARACMANFDSIMQGSDLQKIKASYSSSVNFATPDFAAWLNTNGYLANTVNFQISFGIYTEEAARELNKPQYAGRLTVFIWPIKASSQNVAVAGNVDMGAGDPLSLPADDPQPPFNNGGLVP